MYCVMWIHVVNLCLTELRKDARVAFDGAPPWKVHKVSEITQTS